jgi:hypothetical protein
MEDEEGAVIDAAVEAAEALPRLAPDDVFGAVFAVATPPLEAQRAELASSVADPVPEG